MPVFISHKSTDKLAAFGIRDYLITRNVSCYIDSMDPSLQSTDDITSLLINRINHCTHMMAIVSEYTQGSWWVPFEIGVATQTERRITTYKLASVNLPQYLSKWPILSSQIDLEKFVIKYKEDQTVSFAEGRVAKAAIKTSDEFHRDLKRSLGQY